MFFIAKLHPKLAETEEKNYNGLLLNRAGKEAVVTRFYTEKQNIPLSIDHRDIGAFGYVKDANRVGRVTDLFINGREELMMKCELFRQHSEGYKEVNQGIFRKKERWGVSVGLVGVKDKDARIKARNLVHVALTTDPAFAKEGTFLSHWGLDERKVNTALRKLCIEEGYTGFYRPELMAKLEGVFFFYFPTLYATKKIVLNSFFRPEAIKHGTTNYLRTKRQNESGTCRCYHQRERKFKQARSTRRCERTP